MFSVKDMQWGERTLKNKKAVIFWVLAAAWTWLMFSLSGQPAEESAQLSGGITDWLLEMLSFLNLTHGEMDHIIRKLAHFCMFGAEGFLLYFAVKFSNIGRPAVVAGLACTVIAALNEFHQTFFEGRSCELRDVMIDTAGAVLGIAFAWLCYYCMKSRRRA